jgi:sulfonate transport system ATP-binding protein
MTTGHLILQNLKKTFGNKTAVNITSLSIQPRTFTCIVGKSGCGKTTLLRLLAGLETPDTEEKPDSRNRGSSNHASRTRNVKKDATASPYITGLPGKIAPVFQEPRLMPWLTVKENIMFSLKGSGGNPRHSEPEQRKTSAPSTAVKSNDLKQLKQEAHLINTGAAFPSPEKRCDQLLDELELTDAANLYPAQLSGGMAQRVSLGRTLFYDPELILMDEPFSALDYFTRRNLQDRVLRLFQHQKKTILFVTHDVEEALLLGDRILVMENGSIKADMPVTLPFPRKAADPSLQNMRQQILNLLAE